MTEFLLWGSQGSQDGQRVPCRLRGHAAGGRTGRGWAVELTHHLSCCRPLVRFWVSSPIRSRTAPATCCSKAPPSPPMLRLQRAGGEMPWLMGARRAPPVPHHTHGPASRSPPLAVEVLGPVGDVAVPVLLPGLLPPPLGSLARSWLSPLPAHDLCEGVLTDGGPVTPQPLGVYLPPTPPRLELKAGGSGTLNTWCCHLFPVSASAHTARPHLRPRGGGGRTGAGGWGGTQGRTHSSVSQAV